MLVLAGFASLVSVVLGWRISLRLLGLARRTGGRPERVLAVAFGALFCMGYPLSVLSRAPGIAGTPWSPAIFCAGLGSMAVGIFGFARFPAIVFRPGVAWARALSFAVAALGGVSAVASGHAVATGTSRAEVIAAIQPGALGLTTAVGLALVWNAAESFVYYGQMKRRLALGLAEVETTHRFLLWAIAGACGALQVFVIIAIRASGQPILAPAPALVISLTSLVTSGCWWIGFFMPDFYRDRLGKGPALRDGASS